MEIYSKSIPDDEMYQSKEQIEVKDKCPYSKEDDLASLSQSTSTNQILKNKSVIGVVGTGVMGKQLSLFFSQRGYDVIVKGRTNKSTKNAKESIEKTLQKIYGKGFDDYCRKIGYTEEFDPLQKASIIFEAIVEDGSIKSDILKALSRMSDDCIIATNTSSISINRLSKSCINPERFLGVHFFNPVHRMKLVEIIPCDYTSPECVARVTNFVQDIDKIPIVTKDTPGFIVNRMLMAFIKEATLLMEEGIPAENIDVAVKLGLNHPMGPLELADMIGIDTCNSIMDVISSELKDEKYAPPDIIRQLVEEKHFGKKTNLGFYDYSIKKI